MEVEKLSMIIQALIKACEGKITPDANTVLEQAVDIYISEYIRTSDSLATENQKNYMKSHNITFAEGITKSDASALIGNFMKTQFKEAT